MLSVHLTETSTAMGTAAATAGEGKMHQSPSENHAFLKWAKTAILALHTSPVIMVMVNGLI